MLFSLHHFPPTLSCLPPHTALESRGQCYHFCFSPLTLSSVFYPLVVTFPLSSGWAARVIWLIQCFSEQERIRLKKPGCLQTKYDFQKFVFLREGIFRTRERICPNRAFFWDTGVCVLSMSGRIREGKTSCHHKIFQLPRGRGRERGCMWLWKQEGKGDEEVPGCCCLGGVYCRVPGDCVTSKLPCWKL